MWIAWMDAYYDFWKILIDDVHYVWLSDFGEDPNDETET